MPSVLEAVLSAAESAVGVEYRWGGNSLASGVDCSGLVQQAFKAAGINLPRVSNAQANAGQVIDVRDIQPGDLISWDNSSRNRGADHIAIYVGHGMMIEAPSRGKPVRVVPVPGMQMGRESGQPGNRVRMMVTRVIQDPTAEAPAVSIPLGPNQDRAVTMAGLNVPAGLAGADSAPYAPGANESVVVSGEQGGGLGDGLPPNATPEQTEAYIAENFPSMAGFMENPEIRALMMRAIDDGPDGDWSETRLLQEFQRTEYFRTHSATSMDVDRFLGTAGDAEVKRVTDLAKQSVSNLFSQNGLTLDDKDLSGLAMQAMRAGYINTAGQVANPQGLNGLLSYRLAAQGKMPTGAASLTADTLGATARQYLVPVTRSALEDWTRRIIAGSATEEQFQAWLRDQAKAAFVKDPTVLASLEAGLSPEQHFQAHRAAIAQTLELDESAVDLMDRRFRDVLQYRDPESGQVRSMSWAEAEQWAREQDEFKNTRQYERGEADVATQLIRWTGRAA